MTTPDHRWLDNSTSSTVLSGHGYYRFSLFRSLSHFLDGREFQNEDDLKTSLQSFFELLSKGNRAVTYPFAVYEKEHLPGAKL
uniref:Uncharacterized protein n=1 Tax=Caenorhabditis japonica TaxID=281687 RepID=A0A8R1E181_CAEJA